MQGGCGSGSGSEAPFLLMFGAVGQPSKRQGVARQLAARAPHHNRGAEFFAKTAVFLSLPKPSTINDLKFTVAHPFFRSVKQRQVKGFTEREVSWKRKLLELTT